MEVDKPLKQRVYAWISVFTFILALFLDTRHHSWVGNGLLVLGSVFLTASWTQRGHPAKSVDSN